MAEQVELDISLAKIKQELAELQKELIKTGQVGANSFAGTSKEVQEMAKEVQDLSKAQKEASETAKQVDKSTGGFGAKIKNTIRDTQVAGKSVGEWSEQAKGLVSNLASGEAGAGKFAGAFRVIGTVIKASGIGLLIGIVVSLIGYFTKFQSGADKVSQVMAGLNAVVDVLVGRFLKLGNSILNVATGIGRFLTGDATGAMESFGQAADDAAASVNGLGNELLFAAKAAAQLEKDRQALREFVQDIQKRTAQREVDAAAAARFADDETKSIRVRLSALSQEGTLKKQIAEDELEAAKERQRIALRDLNLNAASRENADKRNEAEAAAIEVIKATGKVQEAVFDAEKKQNELRKKAAEERQKQLKQERDDLEKLRKDLEKLRVEGQAEGIDKELAATNKKYDDLIRIAENGVSKLNEIEKRRGLTPEEQAQRKEFSDLAAQLEEKRLGALLDVVTEFAEKDVEIERELAEQKKALKEKDYDRAVASLNREKTLREQQIAIGEEQGKAYILRLKQQGASEKEVAEAQREFDLAAQQARLRAEIDFQVKLLEITAAQNPERVAEIKKQIELLKSQLENIDFQIGNPEGKKKKSLLELLGIDVKGDPDGQKAIADTVDALKGLAEARLAEAQAAVDAANIKVDAAETAVDKAQEALDREIQLAELGFASNVSLRQQELAAAEQQQKQAEAQRKKAIENQQKIQRQQIILDSVLQASNLITSSTNIYKVLSPLGPFGVGLAIGAIALMLGSFIKQKAAALKAVSAVKAREGIQARIGSDGVVVGPSHDHGGVPLEVEGGELVYQDGKRVSVVKKRSTQTHFDLLKAINDDDRPAMARYVERMTGGISRNAAATDAVVASVRETLVLSQQPDATTRKLWEKNNQLVEENNKLTQKLLDTEKDRVQIFDMGDYYLRIERGRETKVKK